MNKRLTINRHTSIRQKIWPDLQDSLQTVGWALLQVEDVNEKVESDMLTISTLVGQMLQSINMGYHTLDSTGSDEILSVHTEGISNTSGIIPYFALGCVIPSDTGGETRLFDGRLAAQRVSAEPELSGAIIEYSALANPTERVRYPLVVPDSGGTLRFRSKVVTNRVISSGSLSEDEMYARIDQILDESLIVTHKWSIGELMFVNNIITLHDRLPFSGRRRMLRVRYNDEINARIRY